MSGRVDEWTIRQIDKTSHISTQRLAEIMYH